MYFVKAIHKDNNDLKIKRIGLVANNLSSEKEALEHKEFFDRLAYHNLYHTTFEVTNKLEDLVYEQKHTSYTALREGDLYKDCPHSIFYSKSSKQKALELSKNHKQCYKVPRYFLLPTHIFIPIEIYNEVAGNILDAISKAYFNSEDILYFNYLDFSSNYNHKEDILDKDGNIVGILYIYKESLAVIKVSDVTIVSYKEDKTKTMKDIMLDTVLKDVLKVVLDKHGIYSYTNGLDTKYVFPRETIDKIVLDYFKENVLPDLNEIGLQIKKKNMDKFVKNSYNEKVLFLKKHLILNQ